jgi:hypothetical protein
MTDPLLSRLIDLADMEVTMSDYEVFRRSATNWQEFAKARKTVIRRNVTIEQAQRICDDYNDNRTAAQKRRGTKYEFRRQ